MKCPNCGAEMPPNSLYCEHCGEDIHIVPDFEPEVELNIEQTISDIAEDIKAEQGITESSSVELSSVEENPMGEDMRFPGEQQEGSRRRGRGHRRRAKWIVPAVLLLVLALLLAVGGIWTYQYNSEEVQLEKAERCVSQEQYDKAIEYYKRALEINEGDNDVSIRFDLAEVYFLKNNKIEYEYLLREIVKDEDATHEQMESAYGKLIAIYRSRKDYKSINELLLASDNEEVMRTYQDYMALPPEFSIPEGYYTELQPLKLSAYGTGKIYYTLDGSEPNENSEQYTAPIILDDGDYTIRAYYVNEYGIASDYVTGTYHVEIEDLAIPEVSAVSGEYQFPLLIEIVGDTSEVFYTTDGSEPSMASAQYVGPIPMPLGKSVFRFVRMEGGRTSDVVERTYSLVLNTEYTPQQALQDVVAYSLESGKIYDEAGHFNDTEAAYLYEYQYVININKVDDFYVISEILRDESGNLSKTGSHFAVSVYTGEIYKLQIEGYDNYTLVETKVQSEEG